MASETKTGTCLLPSWTAMVCPTISGKIVDARDHVLTIVLLPELFMASMRPIRRSSTHGPFLLERLIGSCPSHDGGRARCSGRCPCSSFESDSPAWEHPTAG